MSKEPKLNFYNKNELFKVGKYFNIIIFKNTLTNFEIFTNNKSYNKLKKSINSDNKVDATKLIINDKMKFNEVDNLDLRSLISISLKVK